MASIIEIFFSYSHKDEALREQLEKQLSLLKRQSIISAWHDRRIIAGQEWKDEIDTHLTTAQIILLLISPDFMASDYCYGIEVKRALEGHERGEARVIPVILRPVYWKGAPFGKLQALPKDAKAITRWGNRDMAFLDVAEGIAEAVDYILEYSSHPTLQKIKEEEPLVAVQSRNTILNNPFDISRPAMAKMFFGRSLEIERMQRELCESKHGRALILYGPRRSGKSSVCKYFIECEVQPPFWGVLFSLQNAVNQNEEAILVQMAEKVHEQFSTQLQQSVPSWHEFNDHDPQIRFRRLLQNCIAQVPNTRLVLVLDEFGGVLESYERRVLDYRFFTFWKELMNDIPQLSLVLVLPTTSHITLTSRKFANVFSFAQPLPLSFLDNESAERLLVDPLREQNIAIHSNTAALAVKLTGGSPYYITLIGQQLIYYLNKERHRQFITDADLQMVIDQLIKGANPSFSFFIRELLSNEELRILEAIVEITNHTHKKTVKLTKIVNLLGLSKSRTRQHLDRLCNGLVLQEHGPPSSHSYAFKNDLIRLWLKGNRWFFVEPELN